MIGSRMGRLEKLAAQLAVPALIWHIWRERNARIFQNSSSSPNRVCRKILSDIRNWLFFLSSNADLCKVSDAFSAAWDLPPAATVPPKPPDICSQANVGSSSLLITPFSSNGNVLLGARFDYSASGSSGFIYTQPSPQSVTLSSLLFIQQILLHLIRKDTPLHQVVLSDQIAKSVTSSVSDNWMHWSHLRAIKVRLCRFNNGKITISTCKETLAEDLSDSMPDGNNTGIFSDVFELPI